MPRTAKGLHIHESRGIHGVKALCGENGIRTRGTVAGAAAYQAAAFGRSAISGKAPLEAVFRRYLNYNYSSTLI